MHNNKIALLFCFVAMLHVWVFSAAFPFFMGYDEREHLDTVVKYARGYLPQQGSTAFDQESAQYILMYGVPDYVCSPLKFPQQVLPKPLCAIPAGPLRNTLEKSREKWIGYNFQVQSPPVYYALAAGWYNFGKILGRHGIELLYWVRFLNVCIISLTVFFAYLFCKEFLPESKLIHWALPLMIAVFPQNVFYAINNDVFSALSFTIAFYFLFRWYFSNKATYFNSYLTGTLVASVFLTNFSNAPIMGVLLILSGLKYIDVKTSNSRREIWAKIAVLIAGAILPIGLWCVRNKMMLGDFSGSMAKTIALGWTVKPFASLWVHPILTPKGAWVFWRDLIVSFWRGDLSWHLKTMHSKAADLVFVWSSLVFLSISVGDLVLFQKDRLKGRQLVLSVSAIVVFLSLIFFVALSMVFDFHNCYFPSRQHPFFTAGRLMIGDILPFLILYLNGLGILLKNYKAATIVTGAIVLLMLFSEITATAKVFSNHYNWFHLNI